MPLPPHQIVRFLRLISSSACRAENRVPLAIIANLVGLSKLTLLRARDSGRVSADTAEVLTPLIRRFEAGKLRFRRTSPRSRDANHWEIIDT